MDKKVLVAYATNAGSTEKVAKVIGEELGKDGTGVEILPIEQVGAVSSYQAVVVGGPMIMGWHRSCLGFLQKHQQDLSRVPVAFFFTAMSLTRTGEDQLQGVPVYVDPQLAKEPKRPGRLSLRERYATVSNYLGPVLKKAPQVRPVKAAFFGGKMEYMRLKLWQMLFVMIIIGAQPGDHRNWEAIHCWGAELAKSI